jgi:uncharacterized protein YecE (DUF72 family)
MPAESRIGIAGWSLPRVHAAVFPLQGTHLQRYAARFNCAEINSSFYRAHRPATYERWARSVPLNFRFAVKMPRAITHDARLRGVAGELDAFLAQTSALGAKRGCVLIQLPPSFAFERALAARFFAMLRRRYQDAVALEPRHASWFDTAADAVLRDHRIARVAADPALLPAAALPGGDRACVYLRLHGAPKMYYSTYPESFLRRVARQLREACMEGAQAWCIFDNTAFGAAVPNALRVQRLFRRG